MVDLSNVIIKDIPYSVTIVWNKNDTIKMENRSNTGLIFVSEGFLYYDLGNKRYISDPNHALLLPQGGTYNIVSMEKSKSHLLNFETDSLSEVKDIVSFKLNTNSVFLKNFYYIDNLRVFKKHSYRLQCMSVLYEMLAKLNESSSSHYIPHHQFNQIKPSISYLETNYNDPSLTNEILAVQSNISTVYFRKLFTKKYGVSPMKYVQIKRIEKAQDMLKSNYSSITSIAESVGFSSIYHFSRAFKKMLGYAPSEFAQYYSDESVT